MKRLSETDVLKKGGTMKSVMVAVVSYAAEITLFFGAAAILVAGMMGLR
jgi:late competence protein required for DNA uptake (superfamily II DNA/RNA helicase)